MMVWVVSVGENGEGLSVASVHSSRALASEHVESMPEFRGRVADRSARLVRWIAANHVDVAEARQFVVRTRRGVA